MFYSRAEKQKADNIITRPAFSFKNLPNFSDGLLVKKNGIGSRQ
jgi:hypothetical protein